MSRTREDVERMLEKLGRPSELLSDGTLLVRLGVSQPEAVVRVEPPVVVLEVNVGNVECEGPVEASALYRRLLELNAKDLLHAAYGLDGQRILLSAALELDNLDANELEAALLDLGLALTKHVPSLRQLASGKVGG